VKEFRKSVKFSIVTGHFKVATLLLIKWQLFDSLCTMARFWPPCRNSITALTGTTKQPQVNFKTQTNV